MQNTSKTAPQAEPRPLTDSDEQLYAVTVDGQTIELTLEQLIAAAGQGLSQANRAARREQAAGEQPNGDVYQAFLDATCSHHISFRFHLLQDI